MRARFVALFAGFAVAVVVAGSAVGTPLRDGGLASVSCSPGYVDASLSWGEKCLRVGEFCKIGNIEYHAYGFDCPASGHLTSYGGASSGTATTAGASASSAAATAPTVGDTVLIGLRTKSSGCSQGVRPDRRCSPGAYYSNLTKAVICSGSFRTSTVRNVPQSEKYTVETDYGMAARLYGHTIEIDHIVPLELGGSNNIANIFPEPGSGKANYHAKDELENRLHDLVCSGAITLPSAQQQIAANWEALYTRVFGKAP